MIIANLSYEKTVAADAIVGGVNTSISGNEGYNSGTVTINNNTSVSNNSSISSGKGSAVSGPTFTNVTNNSNAVNFSQKLKQGVKTSQINKPSSLTVGLFV